MVGQQGFAWPPEDDFVKHFAADVDPATARVMHAVQQPPRLVPNGAACPQYRGQAATLMPCAAVSG